MRSMDTRDIRSWGKVLLLCEAMISVQWRCIIVVCDQETINAVEKVLSQAILNLVNERPWSIDADLASECVRQTPK